MEAEEVEDKVVPLEVTQVLDSPGSIGDGRFSKHGLNKAIDNGKQWGSLP